MAVKNPCLLPYLVLDHNKKSTVAMGVGETLGKKGAGIREKGGRRGEREGKWCGYLLGYWRFQVIL
jgi:hypothetical protein